jgi:glycerol uptake facilitator protein
MPAGLLTPNPVLGEFMGTAMLVLLGTGVVANVCLSDSKGNNSGWGVIAAGWAFAVMVAVFVAVLFGSPDANLNPAITLGFAVASGNFAKVVPYAIAQFAGAFVGALLMYVTYLRQWTRTEDPGLKLATFSTGPAVRQPVANLITEVVATLVLVLGIAAVFSKTVSATGPAAGLGPFLAGGVVWAVGLSLGGPTGFAVNPARDLSSRVAHAILPLGGKGPSDWGYAWIPVLGPFIGAVIAAMLLRMIA